MPAARFSPGNQNKSLVRPFLPRIVNFNITQKYRKGRRSSWPTCTGAAVRV